MKKEPWECGGKIFLELGSEALVLVPAGALLPLSKLPVSFSCQVWKIIPLRLLAQGRAEDPARANSQTIRGRQTEEAAAHTHPEGSMRPASLKGPGSGPARERALTDSRAESTDGTGAGGGGRVSLRALHSLKSFNTAFPSPLGHRSPGKVEGRAPGHPAGTGARVGPSRLLPGPLPHVTLRFRGGIE